MTAKCKLDVPEKPDAPTLREHLEQVQKSTGKRDPLLDSVRIPEGFQYLWDIFWEIRYGASEGMSGIRISWRDIREYSALTGIQFDAFEIEAVMAMDAAILSTRG